MMTVVHQMVFPTAHQDSQAAIHIPITAIGSFNVTTDVKVSFNVDECFGTTQ